MDLIFYSNDIFEDKLNLNGNFKIFKQKNKLYLIWDSINYSESFLLENIEYKFQLIDNKMKLFYILSIIIDK